MTHREKRLVRESFEMLREDAGPLSLLFYGRLFETAPELRPMFRGDIALQGRKLMDMLTAVVDSLDRLDMLSETVHAMGQRHASYGVVPEHYVVVENALVWALGQALMVESRSEALSAWRRLIRDVSAAMMAGVARVS